VLCAGRAANNCTTSVWDVATSTFDGEWRHYVARAGRSARFFDGFELIFEAKTTRLRQVSKNFIAWLISI
jgi:hypothetical protein